MSNILRHKSERGTVRGVPMGVVGPFDDAAAELLVAGGAYERVDLPLQAVEWVWTTQTGADRQPVEWTGEPDPDGKWIAMRAPAEPEPDAPAEPANDGSDE